VWRFTLALPAQRVRPLAQRRHGWQRRIHFPHVVQREALGARECVNAPGAPEMIRSSGRGRAMPWRAYYEAGPARPPPDNRFGPVEAIG
jgi:hypothetical protein